MTLRRFHLASPEPRHTVLRLALERCFEFTRDRAAPELAVALTSKDQLAGLVAELLGADAVRALDRDNVFVRNGLTLHLLTPKIQRRRVHGPVLAVGLPSSQLDRVIAPLGVTEVVFVPHSTVDLANYLAQFPMSEEIAVSTGHGSALDDSRHDAWIEHRGQR